MITSEKALKILKEEGCSPEVIQHTKAVTEKSMEIAEKIAKRGSEVDLRIVEIGSLLHDIGRSKTHDIDHGVVGAQILRERGLSKFAPFAENHLGAGIPIEEAKRLDIPTKDYLPSSLEEKIVTYADNLIRGKETQTYQEALEELREELGSNHPSLQRFKELHQELKELGNI